MNREQHIFLYAFKASTSQLGSFAFFGWDGIVDKRPTDPKGQEMDQLENSHLIYFQLLVCLSATSWKPCRAPRYATLQLDVRKMQDTVTNFAPLDNRPTNCASEPMGVVACFMPRHPGDTSEPYFASRYYPLGVRKVACQAILVEH